MDELINAGISAALEKTTASLIDRISFKSAKEKYEVAKFRLSKGLPDYLAANYDKCETLKTLLNRNDPVALADCFVAPDFRLKGHVISSSEFLDHVNQTGDKVVITGLAGSGKSVFLKYSFRTVIDQGYSYYPVFFELRSLNGLSVKPGFLVSEMFQSVRSCCESFTRAQFNHGLKSGAFYFLLDGFDELKQEIRDQVASEIKMLARTHTKCAILVTSRPSDEFLSWEGFSEAKLQPFDLEKAVEYISKLSFDKEKKEEFLADLRSGLFEKNQEFLSNPLLSAMMLLTYDSFGEIPEKRHIFYAKCFEVLAREHDASKGRYKRELFSKIGTDQLEKVFMFFCAYSYIDRQFSFTQGEIEKYVDDAIASLGIEAQGRAVIKDFRESISIMELVGLSYEFAHRSFQEYFYAMFVVTDRKLSLEKKIGWLFDSFANDDTIQMIADMDRTYFEDEFLIPSIRAVDAKLSKVDVDTNPAGVLSKLFDRLHVLDYVRDNGEESDPVVSYTVSDGRIHFLWREAWKYCNEIFPRPEETSREREERLKREIALLREEPGGEIKIHHTNNRKLRRVGVGQLASEIRKYIGHLRQHLEAKQEKRERGLGALMRKSYGKR